MLTKVLFSFIFKIIFKLQTAIKGQGLKNRLLLALIVPSWKVRGVFISYLFADPDMWLLSESVWCRPFPVFSFRLTLSIPFSNPFGTKIIWKLLHPLSLRTKIDCITGTFFSYQSSNWFPSSTCRFRRKYFFAFYLVRIAINRTFRKSKNVWKTNNVFPFHPIKSAPAISFSLLTSPTQLFTQKNTGGGKGWGLI